MAEIIMPAEIQRIITAAPIEYIQPGQVALTSKYTGSESILSSGEGYFTGQVSIGPIAGAEVTEIGETFLSRLRGRANTVRVPTFRRYFPNVLTISARDRASRRVTVDAAANTVTYSADIKALFTGPASRQCILVLADKATTPLPAALNPFNLTNGFIDGLTGRVFAIHVTQYEALASTIIVDGNTVAPILSRVIAAPQSTVSDASDINVILGQNNNYDRALNNNLSFLGVSRRDTDNPCLVLLKPSAGVQFDEDTTYVNIMSSEPTKTLYMFTDQGLSAQLDFRYLEETTGTVMVGDTAYNYFQACQPTLAATEDGALNLAAYNGAFFTHGGGPKRTRITDIQGASVELEPFPRNIKAGEILTPSRDFLTRSVNASTGQMPYTPDFKGPWLYQWREAF